MIYARQRQMQLDATAEAHIRILALRVAQVPVRKGGRNCTEIAELIGSDRSRVREVEKAALAKLRVAMAREMYQ